MSSDWIEINLPYYAYNKEDSFQGRGLAQPGTLIEVQYYDVVSQFLIGHINQNKGLCDDCVAFENDTLVLRYKIVWNENEI